MPDIKNIQDYTEYEKSVADFIEQEEIEYLSTGSAECADCGGVGHIGGDFDDEACSACEGEGVIREDPWFSWRPCECCGSYLGGNREHLNAMHKPTGKAVQYVICIDCVYYLEYGKLDDTTMLRVEDNPSA